MRMIFSCLCLALCGSCATRDSVPPPRPPDVSINEGAGRKDLLFVTLRMDQTNDLSFLLDTGAPFTLVDKSLEPLLGKPRRFRVWINSMYGRKRENLYRAPQLYLGTAPLRGGPRVATMDFRRLSKDLNGYAHTDHRIMGLLGMDCLEHYCIQLDFAAGQIRFLDPNDPQPPPGRPFPMTFAWGHHVFIRETLIPAPHRRSMLDTGGDLDGTLTPKFYRHWTNGPGSQVVFGGQTYTNLYLAQDPRDIVIGLSFLARNLTTFNFPKRLLYVQPVSAGPLAETAEPIPGTKR
jgi:hypothetical protein